MERLIKIALVLGFISLSGGYVFGQADQEGILLVNASAKGNTWQIRVNGLNGQMSAQYLDHALSEKQGLFDIHTDPATSVCELKALPGISREMIVSVVEGSGYTVSKQF